MPLDKEFYSLREYLLLTEKYVTPGFTARSLHNNQSMIYADRRGENIRNEYIKKYNVHPNECYAVNIVAHYDIAKASWEKYGNAGPPVGCKVITLVDGHNGRSGAIRDFNGIIGTGYDKEYFTLIEERQ